MAGQLTLALIKPHAVFSRKMGKIITDLEAEGFSVIHMKMIQLRDEGAREFYQEHVGKDFFPYLVKVMCSGPILVLVLGKENCVEAWRNFIGATNPAEAEEGTLRHKYGDHVNMTMNAVHGSATDHDALREINFFFSREISLLKELDAADNKPTV